MRLFQTPISSLVAGTSRDLSGDGALRSQDGPITGLANEDSKVERVMPATGTDPV